MKAIVRGCVFRNASYGRSRSRSTIHPEWIQARPVPARTAFLRRRLATAKLPLPAKEECISFQMHFFQLHIRFENVIDLPGVLSADLYEGVCTDILDTCTEQEVILPGSSLPS